MSDDRVLAALRRQLVEELAAATIELHPDCAEEDMGRAGHVAEAELHIAALSRNPHLVRMLMHICYSDLIRKALGEE
jgi:hypothetical protein